ncbi:hypothetical protein ASG76_04340 [Nocardioides sp. Soil774]|uniref:hypothetical protein n=1 Tax=Nocardioides sp. Soil774 TaxID=1736408 RepID=UPI0006F833F0|nr:hypothetical protein [Nocardioides sp. Soil774]KRE96267.1 hypothetical protein ASG76_04340 [Nocardioides sp. Soil774]
MSSARSITALDPGRSVVEQLRERVAAMERRPAAQPVATLPVLADLVPLQAGSTYAVDSASLALALVAGASRAGEWVGFAGCADFGVEAAAELGVELSRTVLVPDPGEHWLEVTAALVDVLRVVVLRPPASVSERTAGLLESRLRTRSSVLVVQGDWPRAEARLSVERSVWTGLASGTGQLEERRARVVVRRGARAPQHADLAWPGAARIEAREVERVREIRASG